MLENLRANRGAEPAENFVPKVRYRSEPGSPGPEGNELRPVPEWVRLPSLPADLEFAMSSPDDLSRELLAAWKARPPKPAVTYADIAKAFRQWSVPQPPDPNPFPRIRLFRRRRRR